VIVTGNPAPPAELDAVLLAESSSPHAAAKSEVAAAPAVVARKRRRENELRDKTRPFQAVFRLA
jgi:hypothetical protein